MKFKTLFLTLVFVSAFSFITCNDGTGGLTTGGRVVHERYRFENASFVTSVYFLTNYDIKVSLGENTLTGTGTGINLDVDPRNISFSYANLYTQGGGRLPPDEGFFDYLYSNNQKIGLVYVTNSGFLSLSLGKSSTPTWGDFSFVNVNDMQETLHNGSLSFYKN